MQLSLRITWAGSGVLHTAHLTAAPGTPGADLRAELARLLGTPCTAVVSGVDLAATSVGAPPLTDGAMVVLTPEARTIEDVTVPVGPARAPTPGSPFPVTLLADSQETAYLVAVEGVGVGTRLPLTRGTHQLNLTPYEPRLLPASQLGNDPAQPTLIMDDAGLRVLPGRAALRHGDRARVRADGRACTLRVSFPAAHTEDLAWPDPAVPPAGFTAQEADPAHPLRVDSPAVGKSRIALITGLLPLVAGIGIAVVTHWWFFLVFSALGAVTSAAGWFGERGARRDHRRRLAAALERDLRRCEKAAPSAAEIVARCRAVQRSARMDSSGPRAATALPHDATTPGRIGAPAARTRRWVRLGHAARSAHVVGDRATALRAAFHPHAPVLLDLAGIASLTLVLDRERAEGVLHALAVQLFTGPAALTALRVSPGITWRPPVAHDLLTVPHENPTASSPDRDVALEVVTPAWAATAPATPGTLRIIVTADPEGAPGDTVVTAGPDGLRLSSRVVHAVPGLTESERGTHLEFTPDTVTFDTAEAAIRAWRRVAGGAHGGPLPRRVGSHELLASSPGPIYTALVGTCRGGSAARPQPATSTAALTAVFGVSSAGPEVVRLDDENPHLLVAGTTGCGKSEVLRTLVTTLAHAFPPDRLEFVFIDFKGGAALAPLTGLPHVTTLLTDLGPDEVRRALAFLRSEVQRRERVLSSLGLNDMAQLLRTGSGALPLRELVIVVDEARMLTDAFPDAGQQLAVIAAVGRSLGVHLVLATQRPQGALSADVRANITQALCLRVRSDQESMDVLGTAAAARIAPGIPGRGFLDRGDGPPVEVQAAVLTRMIPPRPEPLVLRFEPGPLPGPLTAGTGHVRLGASAAREAGVTAAVRDVSRAWHGYLPPTSSDVAPSRVPADAAVPAPLPRHVIAVRTDGEVDLGAAENPAAHWCGRVSWHPWRDGPLLLIGRPEATRNGLFDVLRRCAHTRIPTATVEAHAGVAVYVLTASGQAMEGLTTADGRPLHPAVRGCARVDQPGDVAHLVRQLHEGLEHASTVPGDPPSRAVLAVDDWDRCCQVLRASSWAHLEDELVSLMAAGASRGLSCVVAGDRALVAGRASHLGSNRLYFPRGQSSDALVQWPRLPPFTPYPERAALAGPMAARCTPWDAEDSSGHLAVVQLATGLGPEAPTVTHSAPPEPTVPTDLRDARLVPPRPDEPAGALAAVSQDSLDTGRADGPTHHPANPWPTSFPLPPVWHAPDQSVAGLVLGVTRDGQCAVHPWGPGSTLIVAGPARSGRSTFLEAARSGLSARLPRSGGPGHLVLTGFPRTAAEAEELLRAARSADRSATIIIDDADHLTPDVLRALATAWSPHAATVESHQAADSTATASAQPGVRMIVGVRLTDALAGTFPPLLAWRQHADTLLVRPRRVFDGDVFGVSLTGLALGGPPGRAVWVHRGLAEPVQLPAPAQAVTG
ncbi:FtsK/SpoIIIE domain-containing protein [Kocuria marina]|uniref:FtsK/SpoIIIE domain-containing protein n=1 Tax=Kocuria marina TaxID=223184 RepID=UPI0022E3CD90|nr:FtsK/SpoIIIE domain-containing protein [Kocuria marina]